MNRKIKVISLCLLLIIGITTFVGVKLITGDSDDMTAYEPQVFDQTVDQDTPEEPEIDMTDENGQIIRYEGSSQGEYDGSSDDGDTIKSDHKVDSSQKEDSKKPSNNNTNKPGKDDDNVVVTPPAEDYYEKITAAVTPDENGAVPEGGIDMKGDSDVSAFVPAGVKLDEGTKELIFTVKLKKKTDSDVETSENEELIPYDIHLEGISPDNTTPIVVSMGKVMPAGLNLGNYDLYHVEGEETIKMSGVKSVADLKEHNQFHYEPATGDVALSMAKFSEVAVVTDTVAAWEGKYDYTWYDASKTELTIANADQLAAFGAIVGGMAEGIAQDSFSGKTVKLISDVNLGYGVEDHEYKIFYPIGYYNSTKSYEKASGGTVTSNVSSFEGTFDGNGHTVSNFYQNTWEMFGDYNDGYSGTPNHYKDAMGLFGYVVNGTVTNLIVDNFSSDGEFTPTGVIAAYAVNSTFENIAITNCNPRVYNTGNGGIVGIGGNTNDEASLKLTFENITIDNTNKITALWGSWDVACGGLVGMFRGAGSVDMTNCHVAAQIDVYNDVCGNYQYYWYRYSGMMIGTNKNMTTSADGKYTIPETGEFTTKDCTVDFGDWNNYYYCELVDNSLASYTHDHQFSRLTQVDSVDVENKTVTVGGKTTAVPTSGRVNYVVIKDKTKDASTDNAECYHFVNGVVHNHADKGTETVDGVEGVLKEDKQHVFLPFNQLVTGYGWGVQHVPISGDSTASEIKYAEESFTKGITILGPEANSIDKFDIVDENNNSFESGTTVTVGELFKAKSDLTHPIDTDNVNVTVSPVGNESTAGGTYVPAEANENGEANWTEGTLTFTGTGDAQIIITDYHFCKRTVFDVKITEKQAAEKFVTKFANDYLYRVGNANAVSLGSLFELIEGAEVSGNVSVTIDAVDGTVVSGTYTSNTTWENGKIQFTGTGIVKVTIKDEDDYCTPTVLHLEVIDATNTTSAMSATTGDVVLLNDCDFSSINVKNGHILYGNGFTMTASSDSVAVDRSYGFVELENGTLDNIQIKCPNFSHSILYDSNKSEDDNPSQTDSNGRTRYNNIRSAVVMKGNDKILNSYISGGRAAVYSYLGTHLIENTTIDGGAAANLHVEAVKELTLKDMTFIQEPKKATVNDTSKTLMGLGIVVICDTNGLSSPITLEGTLTQYAWAREDYSQYVPEKGQSFVTTVLNEDNYIHEIEYSDGKKADSVNLGFLYITNGGSAPNNPIDGGTLIDNRIDKALKPYGSINVNGLAEVYSYMNSKGTSTDTATKPIYYPTTQSASKPALSFEDTSDARIFETQYDATEGWVHTLKVDVDQGVYEFNFDKLVASKYGNGLNYTVKDAKGDEVDKSKLVTLDDSSTNVYTLLITDDQIYDENGQLISGASVTHECVFKLLATKTSINKPEWTNKTIDGTSYIVVTTKNSDWNCAVPALEGLKVKYWSKAQSKEVELDLGTITFAAKGLQNGSNNSITITKDDEYTLEITSSGFKTNDNGKPVVIEENGKQILYFTVSSSSNYVSTNTTSRTPTLSYEFTDANNSESITLSISQEVIYANLKETQYKYTSFCDGTLEEASSCVTSDTLVTLADGTQKEIQDVTYDDQLLVWDFYKGEYAAMPAAIIFNHGYDNNKVIKLKFEDGTEVKVVNLHQFFDKTSNDYVDITADSVKEYIGHEFVKQDGDGYTTVKLVDYDVSEEYVEAYGIISAGHYNAFVEGMLSTDFMPQDKPVFNYFEIADNLMFDKEKMAADIEKYGVYTYEDFAEYLTEEQFEAFNVKYMKVAVGKGNYTYEGIIDLIEYYLKDGNDVVSKN